MGEGETGVIGKIALVHQLVLNVRQKGVALQTKISTNNPNEGEMLEFAFAFSNEEVKKYPPLEQMSRFSIQQQIQRELRIMISRRSRAGRKRKLSGHSLNFFRQAITKQR